MPSSFNFFSTRRQARNHMDQVRHESARRTARQTPSARGSMSTSQVLANTLRGTTKSGSKFNINGVTFELKMFLHIHRLALFQLN